MCWDGGSGHSGLGKGTGDDEVGGVNLCWLEVLRDSEVWASGFFGWVRCWNMGDSVSRSFCSFLRVRAADWAS